MDNKYVNRSRISEAKFRELVKLFALDLTATQMAELSGLNRNTINRYITGIRQRLAEYCEARAPFSYPHDCEKLEDVSQVCVGISEKKKAIYTMLLHKASVVGNMDRLELGASLRGSLDVIIAVENHYRIWKSDKLNGQTGSAKIKRINGFWGYVTTRLEKFKGIHSQTYFLHLKESEFRYNNNQGELYTMILNITRNHPLF